MSTLPIVFSKSDIASATQLDAGWYPLTLIEIASGPGKSDPNSITWTLKFEVAQGHKNEGTPLMYWISSKMQSAGTSLLQCFVKDIEPGKQYDLAQMVNHKVQGWCFFEDDGQYRNNKIKDFRSIDAK